jgi:site-specific DNA recombinase
MSNTRAVLYARVSTQDQKRKGARDPAEGSCATQLQHCRELAAQLGATVVGEYTDEAISGDASDRPGYMAMLAAAVRGECDLIVSNEISRLWRNKAETWRCVEDMQHRNVRIVTRNGYDSASPATEYLLAFESVSSAGDLVKASTRTRDELTKMARAGKLVGGCPYGYRHHKVLGAIDRHGNAEVIERRREVMEEQAAIVRRIFTAFAQGASTCAIARALNDDKIPSPGSTWARKVRRCAGWMDSAVHAMLTNEMYIGRYVWNRVRWTKVAPQSSKRRPVAQPRAEWIVTEMPELRIIEEALWAQVQARVRSHKRSDEGLRRGGKSRYVLSGLLRCGVCGHSFTLDSNTHYRCASAQTRACTNAARLRRDVAEELLLSPITKGLLDPKIVAEMAREMERYYLERTGELRTRASTALAELAALDARIERLRGRLVNGDPDMPGDEIEAAIERAAAKRSELAGVRAVSVAARAKVLVLLPKMAAAYREQIERGIDGDARAAAQARAIVSQLIGGSFKLVPDGEGRLVAHFGLHKVPLLRAAGAQGFMVAGAGFEPATFGL